MAFKKEKFDKISNTFFKCPYDRLLAFGLADYGIPGILK